MHLGKHRDDSTHVPIKEGLYSVLDDPNVLGMGRSVTATGDSETDYAVLHVSGILFNLSANGFGDPAAFKLKFSDAPDGTVTYDSATGAVVQHADAATAFAAETTTNKVVTKRYDVPLFEVFKREVTIASDEVYPNGLIQSQATTMNGIATANGTRPASYYAAFEGDTGSVGKCLNYYSLSEAQQAVVLADPWNNFELGSDGKLYQWCLRQFTVDGVGNGELRFLSSTASNAQNSLLRQATGSITKPIAPQGDFDDRLDHSSIGLYNTNNRTDLTVVDEFDNGVFATRNIVRDGRDYSKAGVDGECYALVLGQVSRLNQGVYHPSFNSLGCGRVRNLSGDVDNGRLWYDSAGFNMTNAAQCFTEVTENNGKGNISGNLSGRPDGKFYDAIYANGQGGVIDMRLGGKSLSRFGDDKAALLAGDFLGQEYLVKTEIFAGSLTATGSSKNIYITGSGMGLLPTVGDMFHVYRSDGSVQTSTVSSTGVDGWISTDTITNTELVTHVILTYTTDLPVSGEFTMIDVMGDPANIKNTSDLTNGWIGAWIRDLTAGSLPRSLTRKALYSNAISQYTNDNGANWTNSSYSIDPIKNETPNASQLDVYTTVITYTAHAKVTTPVNRLPVLGGYDSIKDVTAINWKGYGNNILFESILGMINKNSDPSGEIYPTVKMIQSALIDRNLTVTEADWGKLDTNVDHGIQKHEPLNLIQPNNGNSALKVMMYPVVENGQLFIEIIYKQMVHNGTSWGDNNQMLIADGDNLGTDLNAISISYGTHRIGPIGWPEGAA
ncbi:hypothetical protein GCM10007876_21490 [Litoribrevibacter albus]|uniref:Uncharacterized protein n=1 Tax=Litoribrevibacter albus TaxID=1473156 RepID=A0AA37SAS3_9GAMM|nr:hypothetical protein GCM10007876_21490 [Litoribrevibacter albus]